MKDILGKKIVILQIKSSSKLTKVQKANLLGLGLKKIGSQSEFICSKDKIGMIQKVLHLVKVQLI